MMIITSSEAKEMTGSFHESKKMREFMKSLTQVESTKMHNIFNNVKKAAMQGDSFIVVDHSYFTEPMLDMFNFLGYKVIDSELSWK